MAIAPSKPALVMAWIGLPQLLIIPFVPWMMRKVDPRRLLLLGFILFAISSFLNMNLGPDDSGPQLLIPNLIRAVGQALVFPPITMIATAGIQMKDSGSASALFNMLRNLGGAIGIATVQTFVTNREKFHSAIITPQVSLLDPATRERLQLLTGYFEAHGMSDPAAAQHEAVIAIGRTIAAAGELFRLRRCVRAARLRHAGGGGGHALPPPPRRRRRPGRALGNEEEGYFL